MKKKLLLAVIVFGVSILTSSMWVKAASASTYSIKPEGIKSQGKIVFDNGTEDVSDDVIFDAEDIYYLYSICR